MEVPEEEQVTKTLVKKRPRVGSVHSEPDSPKSKRVERESDDSDAVHPESERVSDEPADSGLKLIRDEGIREDLLGILSDSDELADSDSAIQDLDSVIKSLQDELDQTTETDVPPTTSQPDLGYLFEASDDELGLPPANASPASEGGEPSASDAGEMKIPVSSSDNVDFGKVFEFEDEFPSYEFGIVDEETVNDDVVLDGLFCYNEAPPSDRTELPWNRRLPADPTALTG